MIYFFPIVGWGLGYFIQITTKACFGLLVFKAYVQAFETIAKVIAVPLYVQTPCKIANMRTEILYERLAINALALILLIQSVFRLLI
jgi:hypothetical protein